MYTSGIRKIYSPPETCDGLVMTKHWADNSGYDAFCFNGDVYVKVTNSRLGVGRTWVLTPFRVSDFMVNL